MKPYALYAMALLMSTGCVQLPLVAVRNVSHEIAFEVDGKLLKNAQDFRCHFEDLTWISSRGKDWHIRESVNATRVQGTLPTGNKYQAIVRQSNATYSSLVDSEVCVSNSQAVESYLYVESRTGQVERFDQTRTLGSNLSIHNLQSRLTVLGEAADAFKEQKEWPRSVRPSSRYYTIAMTIYERSQWSDLSDVAALIRSGKIPPLNPDGIYPFENWSADDVAIARLRQAEKRLNVYFPTGAGKVPFKSNGHAWTPAPNIREAIQYLESPNKANALQQGPVTAATTSKQWVLHNGSRIQVPLGTYYRFFYEPKLDRLVQFMSEEVDLW